MFPIVRSHTGLVPLAQIGRLSPQKIITSDGNPGREISVSWVGIETLPDDTPRRRPKGGEPLTPEVVRQLGLPTTRHGMVAEGQPWFLCTNTGLLF